MTGFSLSDNLTLKTEGSMAGELSQIFPSCNSWPGTITLQAGIQKINIEDSVDLQQHGNWLGGMKPKDTREIIKPVGI